MFNPNPNPPPAEYAPFTKGGFGVEGGFCRFRVFAVFWQQALQVFKSLRKRALRSFGACRVLCFASLETGSVLGACRVPCFVERALRSLEACRALALQVLERALAARRQWFAPTVKQIRSSCLLVLPAAKIPFFDSMDEVWQQYFRGLRKRSHFGACILVLANHFRAHFWNRIIWTRSDHFFSNMQPENSKVWRCGASQKISSPLV